VVAYSRLQRSGLFEERRYLLAGPDLILGPTDIARVQAYEFGKAAVRSREVLVQMVECVHRGVG